MTTAQSPVARGLFFFRRFLTNPRTVGALFPSTRSMGQAMLAGVDLRRGDVVLEYGPGTGSLTEAILRKSRMVGGLRYLGIEREAGFCAILRARMPEFEFANAQVEDVESLLAERGLPPPKAIISGLPLIFLPSMPAIVGTASSVLAPGGSFRTFSYLQSWITPGARDLRRLMRTHFARFRHGAPVWSNFPPAFVLRGDKAA
jgi:phospholipid N-methyltransferase